MYNYFGSKHCVYLGCDGKEPADEESDEEPRAKKKKQKLEQVNKRSEREEELEEVYQKLKKKHEENYTGPQLRLWARMITANTHEDYGKPSKVPMITGTGQKQQPRRELLTDAFANAATAISKAFSPTPAVLPSSQCSPSKPWK